MSRRRGLRLGVQLALLSAAATAAVITIAFTLLNLRIGETTRALIADQVGQGQRTLVALQARADRQFVAAAALLAASPTLRSALATTRVDAEAPNGHPELAPTVRRELERLAPDLGRDLVMTTDEAGHVFAAYASPDASGAVTDEPTSGTDLSDLPAVRAALDPSLDGSQTALYLSVLRVGDRYFHVAAVPILLDGFTIGTAILGERLDTAHLRDLERSFGGDLAIVADGKLVAATMTHVPPAAMTRAPARDSASDARPHRVRDGSEEFVVASLAIGTTQERTPVRLVMLHGVTATLRSTTRTLLLQFVGFGLVAIVGAALGAALLARAVLVPLDAFVRYLRRSVGASGGSVDVKTLTGRDARVPIEIRWLHLSFARLMASLARNRVRLEHQAYHDPLTGLANRARFRDDVGRALARHGGMPQATAVIFLDLDHFKTVNDSLGHAVGDQLLVEVATRLLHATRGCDTVARLGGDEFAVLVDRVRDDADLVTVVERIRRVMHTPIVLDRAEVMVGASIGAARGEIGNGAEELLRNADVAMYRAKQHGRGRFELFAPAMHAAVLERLELEADLRRALTDPDSELRVLYQPIVALESSRVLGFEALVRWEHPTRGTISPARFIPLAEATGLIIPLGRWVLRAACREAQRWHVPDGDAPYVSVNLSGRQLEDAALVGDVAAALATSGLAPGRLLLEITESVLMHRADAALTALHALKALGLRLAIDDFGTGYSSLAYLQRFPVDVLKIDKAFVDGVARGGADAALARGIVSLGASLGLRCIAEGIEQVDQADALREAGCDYGQGYLFAKPLVPQAAMALLTRETAVAAA